VGDGPFYVKIWPKLTRPFKNADFQSIFACIASAITRSEISSVNTNRNHYELPNEPKINSVAYVAPKLPREGLKNEVMLTVHYVI